MLVCGEDLGMIPACVHPVMEELGLIGAPAQLDALFAALDPAAPPPPLHTQARSLLWSSWRACLPAAPGLLRICRPARAANAQRVRHRVWRPCQVPLHGGSIAVQPRHQHQSELVRRGCRTPRALLLQGMCLQRPRVAWASQLGQWNQARLWSSCAAGAQRRRPRPADVHARHHAANHPAAPGLAGHPGNLANPGWRARLGRQ